MSIYVNGSEAKGLYLRRDGELVQVAGNRNGAKFMRVECYCGGTTDNLKSIGYICVDQDIKVFVNLGIVQSGILQEFYIEHQDLMDIAEFRVLIVQLGTDYSGWMEKIEDRATINGKVFDYYVPITIRDAPGGAQYAENYNITLIQEAAP